MKSKVAIITTGGTIAMSKKGKDAASPHLSGQELVSSVPGLAQMAQVTVESLCNIPSSHMTFTHLLALKKRIHYYQEQGYQGLVITHGTDTMEESAYFMELVTGASPMNLIFTGAQRNPSLPGADGARNLLDAVRVASSPCLSQANPSVLVVFNGEIHGAREVVKAHTTSMAAFQSPDTGPLGYVANQQVYLYRSSTIPREHYPIREMTKKVAILTPSLDEDTTLYDLLFHSSTKPLVDGLIIQGLGGGHVPPALLPTIQSALKKAIPVVVTSRCQGPLLTNTYSFPGSETHLQQLGCLMAHNLPANKARIKLMTLLSYYSALEAITGSTALT